MKIKNVVAVPDKKRPFCRSLTFLFEKNYFLFLNSYFLILIFSFFFFFSSCEYEFRDVPPPPKVAKETIMLEAAYINTPPTALNDIYWKNADWKKITGEDLSTGKLYADGMLNMTNIYNGKTNFNSGSAPDITMKAAYDEQKLYILVEWKDAKLNPASASSQWEGKTDPLKSDSTGGWTSQGNSDKLALSFDINGAGNSAGTFSAAGCAATCHNNGNTTMKPNSGKADLWCWDFALSEPLGYARDMLIDASTGITDDAGQPMFTKNKTNAADNRSAPAYEWDGTEQNITRADGKTAQLDPAHFLLNKIPFTGNPELGKIQYHNATYGCNHCHGENGEGDEAPSFQIPIRSSRAQMLEHASTHEGASYYSQVPASERDNLMAYIRGIGSVPGNILNLPDGSNSDVWTVSSAKLTVVNPSVANSKYQVLFIRNLLTGKQDDVQFSSPEGKEFIFGIALMDGDGKNHIGSNKETLKFMEKQ